MRALAILLPILALPLLVPSCPVRAQEVPPAWRGTWEFMVQSVCIDAADHVLPGASPLDGPAACPRQRKPAPGERLPYHKRDWTDAGSRRDSPGGHQQSDSFPVQTSLGPAAVQTFDFGDAARRFGRFDAGDGGQVVFLSEGSASVGVTEDGGAGLQFFLGPRCTPVDGWVLVAAGFPASPAGETLARITRQPDRCLFRMGYALTRWALQPVRFRVTSRSQPGSAELATLVTDHFGGRAADVAENMERMYFTRELGLTRWERWENLARRDKPDASRMAAQIAASDRCAPGLPPPAATGWAMADCREWTQIVPPTDPAGDPPDFWVDRLRRAPETRAIFAPAQP